MRSISLLFFCLLFQIPAARGEAPAIAWGTKPYRALLVIESWSDPSSVVLDHRKDDFQPVAALLKAWSVPFDIFRLDQQHLDGTYLFDRSGHLRYGVVIWLADPGSYPTQDLTSLADAVQAGTSMIFAHTRFLDPALEKILGLKFKDIYSSTDPFRATQPHFITRELAALKLDTLTQLDHYSEREWVEPEGAEVLIAQGRYPVLTLNRPATGTSAIWMGVANPAQLRDSTYWRDLFLRSMVWSMGYLVRPDVDYSRKFILLEDDWGENSKTLVTYWHYQEPNEEVIQKYLIAPLAKHHAVIGADVCPGLVDRKTHRIVDPWQQKFMDRFGTMQDYQSTYRGLKDAVAAGVMEIESHGWTHMIPDLESPPGPWWTADLNGLGSADGWWQEFGDSLRKQEVPAIAQRFYLTRSLEELVHDFNRRPLLEMLPGGSWSKSYANNSPRVAAHVGFGLYVFNNAFFYLAPDLVLDMYGIAPEVTDAYDRPIRGDQWPAHSDGPLVIVSHDRDVSLSPHHDFLNELFAALPPGSENLSPNQYIGLLHTRISSSSNGNGWEIAFNLGEPYCHYFAKRTSEWQLWLSDPVLDELRALQNVDISVDGRTGTKVTAAALASGKLTIDIPAGMGSHVWRLTPER